MIVAFAGRKCSGKTTLASVLEKEGFTKISFASELKRLVSLIYGWDVKDLSDPVKKEQLLTPPVYWDEKSALKLETIINATKPLDCVRKELKTIRQALQYIGTDVLRKYDNDFHVNSLKKCVESDKNYVLDDVRFKNEVELLKSMGAYCIFIIRPYYFDDYSNHQSEIQLNRTHFDYVILNDGSLSHLLKKFRGFQEFLFEKHEVNLSRNMLLRLFKEYHTTSKIASILCCSRDRIVWWANKYLIPISRNKCYLNENAFLNYNKHSAYWAGLLSADGCVKLVKSHKNSKAYVVELSNNDKVLINGFKKFVQTNKKIYIKRCVGGNKNYNLVINSPFIVEDMKLWNLEPRKSQYNKLPDCLKDDDELLKYWIVGLIDGDGCIKKSRSGKYSENISIEILASKEIIDYVYKKYKCINGSIQKEKRCKNLFYLHYNGKAAIKFYKTIYRGIGLKRKWNKVKVFLKKRWHH